MTSLIKQVSSLGLALLALTACHSTFRKDSIVQIKGRGGSCTGYEIKAPSGHDYLITAGHCVMRMDDTLSFDITTDAGGHVKRKAIALDSASDLLLIEPVPGLKGYEIADFDYKYEFIIIDGYGYGLPAWEVTGRIIGDEPSDVNPAWIETLTSAGAVPGHSGSPVFDPDGRVIGVLSTSNKIVSGFVRLSDLKAFLKGY